MSAQDRIRCFQRIRSGLQRHRNPTAGPFKSGHVGHFYCLGILITAFCFPTCESAEGQLKPNPSVSADGVPAQFANAWQRHTIDATSWGADGVRLADANGDGLLDITTGWEEGGVTRVYHHPGLETVQRPWPAVTVGQTPNVEDAVWVDLDDDGQLDVVSSCEGSTQQLFVHWAPPQAEH